MSQKVSFTADAAISRGEGVQIQADDTAILAAGSAEPAMFVAFEDVAAGSLGAFYTPGSGQVYGIAEGSIGAGERLVNSESADGAFATIGTVSAGTSVNVVGVALTDAVDGGPVWLSFSPSYYTEPV
tara:strand:+ start:6105 stop:6485 length:381 start_codon:yes stop_codon:yes gene_type:complete